MQHKAYLPFCAINQKDIQEVLDARGSPQEWLLYYDRNSEYSTHAKFEALCMRCSQSTYQIIVVMKCHVTY
jgi:hypothetical protein